MRHARSVLEGALSFLIVVRHLGIELEKIYIKSYKKNGEKSHMRKSFDENGVVLVVR